VTAPDAVSNGSAVGVFARSAGRVLLPLAVSAVVVLLLWVVFLEVFGIRRLIGKTPLDVWNWLVTDPKAAANRDVVFANLAVTFRDAGVGFVAGMTAAIVVAVLFVLFRSIEQTFLPVAMLLRSVPLVAMAPVIVLIFGRDLVGVAVIGGIVVFFPALVNIVFGLRSAPRQSRDLVLAYGGSPWTVMRKVALPSALPALFASARISVPGALIGALLAEWLATGQGIGSGMLTAIAGFRYGEMWASVVLVTGSSILLYALVGVLESIVLARFGMAPGRR
jgi:ABC-type nitrate/sulfonate/bicarbonate transport system permease component